MIRRFCRGNIVGEQHAHSALMKEIEATEIPRLITDMPGSVTSIVLPSTLVHAIFTYYPEEFKTRLGGKVKDVLQFWRGFFRRDQCCRWAQHHPFLVGKTVQELKYTIPLTIHEDAGPCSKTSSSNCVGFSSLLSRGDEKMCKFLCFSFIKSTTQNRCEYDAWRRVLQDLEEMTTGKAGGKEIAHDTDTGIIWKFVLLFAKGDGEVQAVTWGLPHHSSKDEVCPDCLADRAYRPYTDLLLTAKWRATERINGSHCGSAEILVFVHVGLKNGHTNVQTDRRAHTHTREEENRRTDGQAHGQTDGFTLKPRLFQNQHIKTHSWNP